MYGFIRFFDKKPKGEELNDTQLHDAVHFDCVVDKTEFDYFLEMYDGKRCEHCEGLGFTRKKVELITK